MNRKPRLINEINGLDIPNGHICQECKFFYGCHLFEVAIAQDRQCGMVPNNFALPGQESEAERFNRQDIELIQN